VTQVTFDALLATSDASLHLPLRDKTRNIIGAQELALTQPTAP
jgi:glycerate dehydrogenase